MECLCVFLTVQHECGSVDQCQSFVYMTNWYVNLYSNAMEQAQLQDALDRANQFDQLYTSLHDLLRKAEEAESKQEPIHSEVEAVKQQMEDHKVSWQSCDLALG